MVLTSILYLNYQFSSNEIITEELVIKGSQNMSSRRQKVRTTKFEVNHNGLDKLIYVGAGYSVHKNKYKIMALKISKGPLFDVIKSGKPLK